MKGRVLLAKLGLDGHDRGSRLIVRLLMDAGFEVIYTGLRQTPQAVVNAAAQEDVDLVGISILSGSHMTLVPAVIDLLRTKDMAHIPVVVGGIVPDHDVEALTARGVSQVLGPGSSSEQIVTSIEKLVAAKRREDEGRIL